jgi:hypothetical protein
MKTDTRERTPIVVVDDDQGILDSFEVMLGDDYALIMTDNGIDAIQLLRNRQPAAGISGPQNTATQRDRGTEVGVGKCAVDKSGDRHGVAAETLRRDRKPVRLFPVS